MFREVLNEKIGNLLIYLSDNISDLSLTKALKLLYIIDEISMKEIGVPVTWLEYKVWKNGPVAPEIWDEVQKGITCGDNKLVGKYIKLKKTGNPVNPTMRDVTYFVPETTFDDGEFTDYEMGLLDRVIQRFGNKSANELINYLHKTNSLWFIEKERNNLDFELQGGTSNVTVPLTELIKDKEQQKNIYMSAFESLSFECDILSK